MIIEEYKIARLSEEYLGDLANFDCTVVPSATPRKRKELVRHSEDMNYFLHNEALDEQLEGYNTTFLVINDYNEIIAYLSLCTDAIRLNHEERDHGQIAYETFPSLKIARLAVHKNYQKRGIGKWLIRYTVFKALELREGFCGVKFITLDCFPHRLSYYESVGFIKNQERQNTANDSIISLRLQIDEYLDKLPIDS
ncbi:GNAT family N-acetyltransferase [Paenibacillus sp. SN-8-1]|uniref:GNAT family N-acetyltransferase n=1 Tax=Paenibacillus sp. SN-8-1 TaxID=3435409 RepID=UPI003D9A295F